MEQFHRCVACEGRHQSHVGWDQLLRVSYNGSNIVQGREGIDRCTLLSVVIAYSVVPKFLQKGKRIFSNHMHCH